MWWGENFNLPLNPRVPKRFEVHIGKRRGREQGKNVQILVSSVKQFSGKAWGMANTSWTPEEIEIHWISHQNSVKSGAILQISWESLWIKPNQTRSEVTFESRDLERREGEVEVMER